MRVSQWEGEGVTHTEQNRPREREREQGRKGGRVKREGERNSGPNSFSA